MVGNKRSFTISYSEVPVNEGNRYESSTPRGAALKAIRRIYETGTKKKEIKFTMRETTQSSMHKEYSYFGAKFELKTPKVIKLGNATVTYSNEFNVRRCGPH